MKSLRIFSLFICCGILAFALCSAEIKAPQTGTQAICTADGVCYLPGTEPETAGKKVSTAEKFLLKRTIAGDPGAEKFLEFLRGNSGSQTSEWGFWGMLIFAFLGGIALNLTPCVLPMIPINLALISGGKSTGKWFRGMIYGSGIALCYGCLGLFAAFAGTTLGVLNASPAFNFAIGIIFLLLSASMAGVWNFDLAGKFHALRNKIPANGNIVAVFFLGMISALLAGSCIAPVVTSVLLFTAKSCQEGNLYAAILPFALGVGMALPWPLAGAGWAILPKPGRFMVGVKYIFSLMIFILAAYYIMLGVKLLPSETYDSPNGFAALENARQTALLEKKDILVKFTASWCKNCAAMDKSTLKDPEVQNFIDRNYILAVFPAENPSDPEIAALLKAWNIPGFPAFAIVSPAANEK